MSLSIRGRAVGSLVQERGKTRFPILKDDGLEWSDGHGREWLVNVQRIECR